MTDTGADEFRANTTILASDAGLVLRTRDVDVPRLAGCKRAWQLIYTTKTSFGIPVAASGIVLEPDHRADVLSNPPLVVYCPTFHGLGGARTAPSQLLAEGREPDARSISTALVQGWTVAVPDGIGLGINGAGPLHFLAAKASAHAVLDLARAVVSQPAGGSEGAVAVWGYADGGRAATAAAELQHEYAPDVDLRAVAAGAVIRDPGALVVALDGGPWSGLGFAGMVGLAHAYKHLPVDHLLTDAGVRAAAEASEFDLATLLVEFLTPLASWCERPDPWNDPVWRLILAQEKLGTTHAPKVPVHLYHGLTDGLVPIESGRSLFAEYTSRKVPVSWSEFPVPHLGAADLGVPDVLNHFHQGFDRPSGRGPIPAP